ncbi:MAG: LON peptidase substrate-binding domain-containing protein [Arenimonas sp.]|nr:LON peptidase substrate-binding domain-containing protein [Arenimonas sp.]
MATDELPLFPLSSVLFPGGTLGLRLFEPRYLDLVKRCGRSGEGFGICLILDGREAGMPATSAALGTEAAIVDFAMTDDGLLGITVEGRRRFHVERTRVRSDGLVMADVRWLPAPEPQALRDEHALLALLLARILDKAGIEHGGAGKGDLADAAYVGWRLAEWLPLSGEERQWLLQEDDPHRRLDQLLQRLPDFQPE